MWGQLACLSFLQPSDHLATTLLPHASVVGGLREAEVVVGDLGEVGGRAIGRRARGVKGWRLYTLLKIRQSVLKLKIGRWCPKTLFCLPVYSSPLDSQISWSGHDSREKQISFDSRTSNSFQEVSI